ncbi:hypothetical protein ACOMHN_029926 [Nucella lapillus]
MSSRWVPWQRMPSRYQLSKRDEWNGGEGEGGGPESPRSNHNLRPSSARLASPRHLPNGAAFSVCLQGRRPGSETSLNPRTGNPSSKHRSLPQQRTSNGDDTEGSNVAARSPRGLPARSSAYINTLKHHKWIATARKQMGEGRFVDVLPVGSAVTRDNMDACLDSSDHPEGSRPLHVVVGQGYEPHGTVTDNDIASTATDQQSNGLTTSPPMHVVIGYGSQPPSSSPPGPDVSHGSSQQPGSPRHGITSSRPGATSTEHVTSPKERVTAPRDRVITPKERAMAFRERVVACVSTHREHVSTPRERVTALRENVTTPRERVTTPRENVTTPREGVTTPRENVTTPRERVTTPRENVTTPRERVTTPRESVTTPRERVTTPRENVTTPKERVTTPRESITTLRESMTTPRERVTTHRQSVITPRENVSTPRERVTPPREWFTSPRHDVSGGGSGGVVQSARVPRRQELRPSTSGGGGGGDRRQRDEDLSVHGEVCGATQSNAGYSASHNRYPARSPRQQRRVNSARERGRGEKDYTTIDGRPVQAVHLAQKQWEPHKASPALRSASSTDRAHRDDGSYMAQLRKDYLSRARDLSKTAPAQSPRTSKLSLAQPQSRYVERKSSRPEERRSLNLRPEERRSLNLRPEERMSLNPRPEAEGVLAQRQEYSRRVGDILNYYTRVEVSSKLHGPRPPDAPHHFPPPSTLPEKPAFRPLAARRKKARGSSSAGPQKSPRAIFSLESEGCPFSPRKQTLSPRPHSAREYRSPGLVSPRDTSALPQSARDPRSGAFSIPHGAGQQASAVGSEEHEGCGSDPENFVCINVQARLHRRLHFYLQTPSGPEEVRDQQARALQHTVPAAPTSTCTLCDLEREVASRGILADNVALDLDLVAGIPLQDTVTGPHTSGHAFRPSPAQGQEFTRDDTGLSPFRESFVLQNQQISAYIPGDKTYRDDEYEDSEDDWPQVEEMKMASGNSQEDAELGTETPPQNLMPSQEAGSADVPEEDRLSGHARQEAGAAQTEEGGETGSANFAQTQAADESELVDDKQEAGGSCTCSLYTQVDLECKENGDEGGDEGPGNACDQWTQTPKRHVCGSNGCTHQKHQPFLAEWDSGIMQDLDWHDCDSHNIQNYARS